MTLEILYSYYKKCNKVTIDSRNINQNDIFIALKGSQVNSNTFAEDAIKKGALLALVDDETFQQKAKNIYYVHDTLTCLQALATHHRAQLTIPIIALTGSNGKTTTKELIANVLQQKFNTLYTFGNLNNHIGVPLTILSIKPEHEMAVIEMGANHQQEIEFLCTICKPDIGYITNFGKAHLEGFGGEEGVIKGKSELIDYLHSHDKTLLVNETDAKQVALSSHLKTITFGTSKSQYLYECNIDKETNFLQITYEKTQIKANLTGIYNFSNLSAAISLGLFFDISIENIKKGIEGYFPQNYRSQIIQRNNLTIVMDAYNANPSSMEVALYNFSTFSGSKTVILGDMFELGEASEVEHQKIASLAQSLTIDSIFLVGKFFHAISLENIQTFELREELQLFLQNHPINTNNLLIKGSRGMALEKLLDYI